MHQRFALSRSLATALAAVLVSASADSAQAVLVSYTGASGGDWATGTNWSSGAYPTSADYAVLDTTANLSTDVSGSNLLAIRIGSSGTGVFNILPGGSVKATASSNWDSALGYGSGSNGTVNQSGGSADINYLEVGRLVTSTYNLTGGDLLISRGRAGNSLYLGTDDTKGVEGGTGTLEISGGSFK
ncbi:unnamed protein product [Ectocarpus sp. 4 AP-2014]